MISYNVRVQSRCNVNMKRCFDFVYFQHSLKQNYLLRLVLPSVLDQASTCPGTPEAGVCFCVTEPQYGIFLSPPFVGCCSVAHLLWPVCLLLQRSCVARSPALSPHSTPALLLIRGFQCVFRLILVEMLSFTRQQTAFQTPQSYTHPTVSVIMLSVGHWVYLH